MTSLDDFPSTPTTEARPRSRWSIVVEKEYHKFSAAHFLIFEDGSAERLHGHNYQVSVEIESEHASHGMVVDFKVIKPVIGEILDRLDERCLIPGKHPILVYERLDRDEIEIRYLDRRYVLPAEDVVVLPISNTSAENLASWIAEALTRELQTRFFDIPFASLRIGVEETPGQRGVVTLRF